MNARCSIRRNRINRSITLAKYIEHWVTDIGPKKLADSTFDATNRIFAESCQHWATTS